MMAWWLLVGAALAQDCPDPVPLLGGAENDALNYYLADAKAGLAEVVDAWGCGPRAEPKHVGRYLQVRGLLAYLDGDEATATRSFAGARALGATFVADYGPDAEALWNAATPPEGQATALVLKGRNDGEWLAIDGVDGEPKVSGGFHLVQVGTSEKARTARMVDATGGEMIVALPTAAPAPPAPEPTPPAPEPAPAPEPEVPVEPAPTADANGLTPPFERKAGRVYVDSTGVAIDWRDDVLPLARQDRFGQQAQRRFRTNPLAQGVALTLAPAAGYGAYVFGWDATVGRNLEPAVSWTATAGLATVAAGAVVWETLLLLRRPKRRADVATAAGRVASGEAITD